MSKVHAAAVRAVSNVEWKHSRERYDNNQSISDEEAAELVTKEYAPLVEASQLIERRFLSSSSGVAFAKFMAERGLPELRQAVSKITGASHEP